MDRIHAFAKINLFLNIVGKADGYHQLESLFQTVSLADEMSFEESDRSAFTCNQSNLVSENLILKACQLLTASYQLPALRIHLEKKVPIAAGLGGGSSDAAATLNYLNQKYKLDISISKLKEYAAQIGSDVPFFIEGGTQFVTGRGEICNPVSALPQAWILLVNPGIDCPTPAVFKNFAGTSFSKPIDSNWLSKPYDWKSLKPFLRNDLLGAALKVVPPIQKVLDIFGKTQALYSGLSGSGATCFGIYETQVAAQSAYNQFQDVAFRFIATPTAHAWAKL